MKPIIIVQGGGYGSEAKGAIAAHLARSRNVEYAVRTGATNAGHTVEYKGKFYVNQQLPTAWVNLETVLVIGAGALIDPTILRREVEMIAGATGESLEEVADRIRIDYRAYMHLPVHALRSKESGRHHAMGATGKGCSEALIDRIRQRGDVEHWTVNDYIKRVDPVFPFGCIGDTEHLLNSAIDGGAQLLIEGTQGTLLDLYLGPYPFTTHKQTTPAQWMSEAGISPRIPTDIVMVIRTKPIRVAGNSGPLPNETSWPLLARNINDKRDAAHLPPIVADWAVFEFETALKEVAGNRRGSYSKMDLPAGSDGTDQHLWTPEQRSEYRVALSELNAETLRVLPPDTVAELRKLFEVTTVTKKLRRVADLSAADLTTAARQVRPTSIAVTFLNYVFPERWGGDASPTGEEMDWLRREIVSSCGDEAEVTLFNRGPHASEIVEVG